MGRLDPLVFRWLVTLIKHSDNSVDGGGMHLVEAQASLVRLATTLSSSWLRLSNTSLANNTSSCHSRAEHCLLPCTFCCILGAPWCVAKSNQPELAARRALDGPSPHRRRFAWCPSTHRHAATGPTQDFAVWRTRARPAFLTAAVVLQVEGLHWASSIAIPGSSARVARPPLPPPKEMDE